MAQNVAKGTIALTVDEAGLEASLSFTPDQDGAEWTADKVLRLAMDARIGGLNQKRADEIVGKFARSKMKVSELIAKGQDPEQPVPESVRWVELAPPADLAGLAGELLAAAGPPEVNRIVVETVSRERIVTRPGPFPFLPSKTEKTVVQEKVEKRERVIPDPAVSTTGYAAKDTVIGEVYAAKPGKPGKSVYARPLAAGPDPGPFLLGRGIQRTKGGLVAEYDGVLRAGERWAELIPLAKHRWDVKRSADGASFFLSYQPGHPRLPVPRAAEILADCVAKGATQDSLIPEPELATALESSLRDGEALFSRCLSSDRDASVTASVSPDGLRATLTIRKARGHGKALDLGMVGPALRALDLRGFNADKAKKDILEFVKATETELVDYLLVEGKPPLRGKDRTVNLSLAFLSDDKGAAMRARLLHHPALSKVLPSAASLPLDEACRFGPVKEGQRFAEISATTPGIPGVDVHGTALPGLPGNDPPVRVHENVGRDREGLVALKTGLLVSGEREGVLHVRVIPYRDCGMEAGIAADGMSAWVSLVPEVGLGTPLSVEGAIAALQAKGVAQGIDAEALGRAVIQARSGEAVLRRTVAAGKPAVAPGGLRIRWLAGGVESDTQPARARLAAGGPILRIEAGPGGAGQEGLDVFGKPVKPPPAGGQAAAPSHDETVREETGPDGSVTWRSTAAGELQVLGGRVGVRQRLDLPGDVGQAGGNVEFGGSVNLAGSVLTGYRLVAGGDVVIGGAVEAALVSGDGSITVRGGVRGAKRGTLRAKRGIEAAFAEQAIILAVDDVKIGAGCHSCNVKTNGRLLLAGDKGFLVGGLVRARKGVEVQDLGSEKAMKTEVCFGQDYLVRDLIEAEELEIGRLKELILRADREMARLEGAGAGLDRLRQDKVKLMKLLEKRSLRVFDFRERYEEHFPSEVRVRGMAFPGAILESHNRFFEIRSRKSRVSFSFDPGSGRIVERPL